MTEGKSQSLIPYGKENAVVLFKNVELESITLERLGGTLVGKWGGYNSYELNLRKGAGSNKAGIYHLKREAGCLYAQFQGSSGGPSFYVKLGLTQVGEDVAGWVESAGQMDVAIGSDIDTMKPYSYGGCGYCYEDITKTVEGQSGTQHALLRDLYLTETRVSHFDFCGGLDTLTTDAEISFGERVAADLKGTLGAFSEDRGMHVFSGILCTENAKDASPAEVTLSGVSPIWFARRIRCPNVLEDAKRGLFLVGKGATAYFNDWNDVSEGSLGRIHVYGTAVQTGYRGMPAHVTVFDGGLLVAKFTNGYNSDGWSNEHRISLEKGGLMRLETKGALNTYDGTDFTYDGATLMNDYVFASDSETSAFVVMTLKNGARVCGSRIDAGANFKHYKGPTITCLGSSPSLIENEGLWCFHGENMAESSNQNFAQFRVDDVTGDDASDLIVTAPVLDKAKNQKAVVTDSGLWKKNAGTLELSGGAEFNGVLKMEARTVCFRTKGGAFGGLLVVGDSALDLADGARVAFGDSSSVAWTEGKTLTLATRLERKSLRFGTDANGLTVEQLAAIRYADGVTTKTPVFALDENGYLTDGLGGGFFLRVR